MGRGVATVGAGTGSARSEAGEPPAVNDANTAPVVESGAGAGSAPLPETILKASTTKTPTPAVELLRTEAGNVEATTVAMERSGAERVVGQRVIMTRGGAKTVEARSAQLDRSGVLSLKADRAVFQSSSVLAVAAQEARLVKGKALVVVSKGTTLDEGTRVFLHVGPTARCATPTVGAAGAAAFGVALGLVLALARLALGRRGR